MSAVIPVQHPFKAGQSIASRLSEEHGNLPITGLEDLTRHAAANLGIPVEQVSRIVSYWPAKIAAPPDGGTVFTNENYYLERQRVTTDTGSDHTAIISTETLPGCIQTVIGVNVAEKAAGTHLLSVGTYVLVFEFLGQDGTARRQYLFFAGTGRASASFAVLVDPNGTDADGPTYDVYDEADVGLVTPLNLSGPLSPNGLSRWRGAPSLTLTAAASGSKGYAHYTPAGVIDLDLVGETICTG